MKERAKTPVKVEIFNRTFTVTSEDDEHYVKELASYVDQRMRQIEGSTKTAVSLRVAIMAALSIADEYFQACTREAEIKQEVEHFSTLLCERLEQSEHHDKDLPSVPSFSDARAGMISKGEDPSAHLSLP